MSSCCEQAPDLGADRHGIVKRSGYTPIRWNGPTTTLAFCGLGAAALATSVLTLGRRLELSRAKHRSLAGHARMARRLAGFVPFYEYDEDRFFGSRRRARRDRRRGAAPASCGWRRSTRRASPRRSAAAPRPPKPSPTCNSPTPIACRSSIAASCASICRSARFLQSSERRDGDRSRRQPLLRPHRLLRRQPASATTSTRNASSAAPTACASSARCSAPITR